MKVKKTIEYVVCYYFENKKDSEHWYHAKSLDDIHGLIDWCIDRDMQIKYVKPIREWREEQCSK